MQNPAKNMRFALQPEVATETSTSLLTVEFFDCDWQPVTPDVVKYRVDDVGTRQQIRGATALQPASKINLFITPEDNAIVNQERVYETRALTFLVEHQGKHLNHQFCYRLENLKFVG